MSTSHTTTTTLEDPLGRSSAIGLDSNRDYNHAVHTLYGSPSVATGSIHYALPQQSHPPRTLIPPPPNNDPSPSSSQPQQQQQDSQMYRSPNLELSQQHEPRSAGKRKQSDGSPGEKSSKKRKQSIGGLDGDEITTPDNHGAKHWTDEEKTKFFVWLLGSDEHWDAFSTKMNTCFRECAQTIFAGRKTFTALKSCYHRNLETFKQLSSFENFNGPLEAGILDPSNHNERQAHFEKRLDIARNGGCPIGNLSPRIVDGWIRNGWFDLFKSRFYGDINRPLLVIPTDTPPHNHLGETETQLQDHGPVPSPEPSQSVHLHSQSPLMTNGSMTTTPRHHMLPPPPPPPLHVTYQPPPTLMHPPPGQSPMEQTVAHLSALTQNLIATYAHMVQTQSEDSRLKLEYMKRREEREEEDSRLKREADKRREEREAAEWESTKEREKIKQKADLATQLLSNSDLEASVKQAAGEYLKQLFAF